MPIVPNIAKERLNAGKVAIGLGVRYSRSIEIARMAASSGYHFLFIDLEHSTIEIDMASQICVAALDAGVTPIVRIPGFDLTYAARILDGGAQGIIVPHINSAEEARAAVAGCLFPPAGHRSTMATAVQTGWEAMPARDFARTVNDNVLLVAILETPQGIENAEEIAAVDGIDVLSLGSNDLAMEMGIPGEFDHPRLLEAYRTVVAAANRHGKAVRIGGIYEPRLVLRSIEIGSRMLMLGTDFSFMLKGMRSSLADMTAAIDPNLTIAL